VYIFELSLGVTEPAFHSLVLLVSPVPGSSARPPEAPGSSVPHLRQQQHPTPPYNGSSPPLETIYSLSPTELEALRTFIDEHLHYGFIRLTNSAHAAPVLFVKKKDGSLRLCVDFHGLNKITKKDRYPLPLISDLLDSPSRVTIHTKINL